MSDSPPLLATEQSNSGSDDFEFIEKEEGITSKGSYDAIPDLIQTAQQSELDVKDEVSTDQDSNLISLVDLDVVTSVSPGSDSLVIIEPEIPTESNEEIPTKDRENVEETAAKVDEITLSKEDADLGDVTIKYSGEISPTDPEINPEDINPKDSEIFDVIPSEKREISDETLTQNRESLEGTISKDRESSEQPDSKDDGILQENTFKNTEIEPVINPTTDDDVIDKNDAEVIDILFSPKETMDSDLTDNTGSPSYLQQLLDDDNTEIEVPDKRTFRNSTDSPDLDNSTSTNVTGEDPTQDDEPVQYTDRQNSTEADQAVTSYVYPVEQEFWEVEDLEDPQASQVRWRHLYTQLNLRSSEDPPSQHVARMYEHRPLNRYSNILANDSTRIRLTHPDTHYINANRITIPEVDRAYIMTQGPLDITCDHFWYMVWHEECPGIVMLNRTVESGKLKCFQYFPKDPGQKLIFGDFQIDCTRQFETACYRMSDLQLTHLPTEQTRTITHFQYLSWPDFGAPETPEDFLQFLVAVRDKGLLDTDVYGPPVVHCSAGVGRSGTFILVDACLRRIEIEGHPLNVHVQDTILYMRTQRYGCIQSDEQLRFSYVAILVATHNLMAEAPIALIPELVEREIEEITASPIPPRRTSSRVQIQNEPPEIPPRNVPRVEAESTPTEVTSTTTTATTTTTTTAPTPSTTDQIPEIAEGIRERRVNAEIIETIDEINERDLQYSKLNYVLGVVAVSFGVGLFYLMFF